MSGLTITQLDVRDDAEFTAWHAAYEAAERHGRGDLATVWAREELWLKMTEPSRSSETAGLVGRLGDRVVATGFLEASLLDNLESAYVEVTVHPDHLRSGHGSAMLARLEEFALGRGRRVLRSEAAWPHELGSEGDGTAGREFARARGYDLGLVDVKRTLDVPVPESLLDTLAAEAAAYHRDYTLRSFVGAVPDDLLQGWAELSASLMTEAPAGDIEREPEVVDVEAVREREALTAKQGRKKYNTVALDATGAVVAYTDIAVSGYERGRAYQWGTLVRPADRGHRLGLAIKVANLQLLQQDTSDVSQVFTWNAEVNDHMIGVNERLGFRPVEYSGEFQKKLA
jgi:GNAT superfamily N-acetyltransferase